MKARKVIDSNGSGVYTQGPRTTYSYPANTWEGYERVWSGGEEKEGVYFGVLAQTSLGRNVLLEWHLTQKK